MSYSEYRSDFPLLHKKKELVYLDTAATSHKPACVLERLDHFYREEYGTVHRGIYELSKQATEIYGGARKTVQRFLHARYEEEVIFTRGTTDSLNLVARSFAKAFLKKGDVILLTEIEHHANLVPWQMVAEEGGFLLKFMPVDEGGQIDVEQAAALFSEKVKIVSFAHISNVLGTKQPVEEVVALCRKWGAKVCLDGAQSASHLAIDVQKLDVDFFAFSAHKAYGPTGVGVLYGKKELLEKMPPISGGGDMVEKVTLEKTTFAPLPLKFEAGTPMIASVVGLQAALDYMTGIGMEEIARFEERLVTYALEGLQNIPGIHLLGKGAERGAILTFVVDGVHPLDVGCLLDAKGIAIRTGHHCSQPALARFGLKSACRASFGIYNSKDEIDFFLSELKMILLKVGSDDTKKALCSTHH